MNGGENGMESKSRILIVDDDPKVRGSLSVVLRRNQYHVETAKNGREAIRKSRTGFFNLVLLDINLPDIEGTKLLTKLHKHQPEMKKIMITGYPSLENAVESLNLGADAYIIKPVKPEQLLTHIQDRLQKQREAGIMTHKKVAEWVKTQVNKIQQNI